MYVCLRRSSIFICLCQLKTRQLRNNFNPVHMWVLLRQIYYWLLVRFATVLAMRMRNTSTKPVKNVLTGDVFCPFTSCSFLHNNTTSAPCHRIHLAVSLTTTTFCQPFIDILQFWLQLTTKCLHLQLPTSSIHCLLYFRPQLTLYYHE